MERGRAAGLVGRTAKTIVTGISRTEFVKVSETSGS